VVHGGNDMEYSYKFKNIENNLEKLLTAFLANEDFKKYVYYLSDNPLAETIVPTDKQVRDNNIVLTPFDEDVLDNTKVTMFINPIEGDYSRTPLSAITFLVEIVVPIKKWLLPGIVNIRAFRIADEIAKDIDQKHVAGISEVIVGKHKLFKLNKEFSGITLPVTVRSSTQKG